MAAADYNALVQELYISYFGRPADPRGLANFSAALDALHAPTTIDALVTALASPAGQNTALKTLINNSFSSSAEAKALYSNADNLAFVGQIYKNVLNRTGDTDGLLYWAAKLDNHELSRENAAIAIMQGALANTSAQGVIDAALVQNKVTIAGNFTAAIDTGDELLAYAGDAAAASARNMLGNVTSTTDAAVFQATVNQTLQNLVNIANAGQTFTLTSGFDVLNGTTLNDVFVGNKSDGSALTLSTFDNIDGGLGNDTLSLTLTGNLDTTTLSSVTIKNIENVVLQSGGTVKADTSAWTGVTKVTSAGVGGVDLTAATTTTVVAADAGLANAVAKVSGGADVTLSAANVGVDNVDNSAANAVTVSGATGNVIVAVTSANSATGGEKLGTIVVNGGKTVSVTETAGQTTVNKTQTLGNVTVTGDATTSTVTVKQTAASTASATKVGVVDGTVTITDKNSANTDGTKANSIKTVTLDGYGAATVNSNALTSLSLANSAAAVSVVDNTATVTNKTLAVTANNLSGAASLTDNTITTVNLTASGKGSTLAVNGTALKTVTVAGDQTIDLSGSSMAAVTAFTSTNTGGVTVSLNAGSTGTFGDGADVVTVAAGATKAITLGGGNDTAIVSTLGTGGSVAGGTGTNTLQMVVADAVTASGSNAFSQAVTGFQKLALTGGTGTQAVDVAVLGGYSDITANTAGTLNLSGTNSGATLTLNAAGGTYNVAQTNALAGTNDVLNVKLTSGATANFGTVGAANVEVINVTTADTSSTPSGAVMETLTLSGNDVKTVVVSGSAATTLVAASTAITSVDASALTVAGSGAANTGLTYTTGALAAVATIKGSANGGDVINAAASTKAVTIIEKAGTNTITGSSTVGSTLTGGTGNDAITGGSGSDTISGGTGTNTITGGAGADAITITGGKNTIVQAAGDSGANTANNIQTSELTSTFDVIKGAVAGDKINLGAMGYVTADLVLAGTNLAAQDNKVVFVSGNYDAASGTFTFAANGADTVVTYDTNTAGGTVAGQSIILVGFHAGADTAAAAGLITLA